MVLRRVEGVRSADVSYEAGRAVVVFDPAVTSPAEFIEQLERMTDFEARVEDDASDGTHQEGMHDPDTDPTSR